jgi:hypothetical protein
MTELVEFMGVIAFHALHEHKAINQDNIAVGNTFTFSNKKPNSLLPNIHIGNAC